MLLGGCSSPTLFRAVDAAETSVNFANVLTESETQNVLAYEYFYNGGGVAVADFDNDGRTDVYFTGNQVANKLYLNQGDWKFEDVTQRAGVAGRAASWKTGVTVADVNADGWLDIYVCYSGNGSPESRKNQLFISQGLTPEKKLVFTEQAQAYGLADEGYSTQATFFDYDHDGDLDLFLINHNLKNYQRKEAAAMKTAVDAFAGDKLYRNDGTRFTDVTTSAGIISNPLGFGLGVSVADFNGDNWPDIYVANDYVEQDYLYYNNRNGTFSEVGKDVIGHFSYSAMGTDAADVNNDAVPDIFSCDMLPADNARQKKLAFPDNWNVQQSMLQNGFHWQNMRNMLQLNTNKGRSFSEIGQLAGVSNTDWSWAPLLADFDNDGFKDLFVSNGFVRDLTDLDFVKYQLSQQEQSTSKTAQTLLAQTKQMPATATHHYIFKNKGDLTFEDKVADWGFERQTVACGAASADLDGDGDLDLITNNTNQTACLYRNYQQESAPQQYLEVKLTGEPKNPFGVGAKVYVYTAQGVQYQEFIPTRGFQACAHVPLHFGMGQVTKIDSVVVVWPNDSVSKHYSIPTNVPLVAQYQQATAVPRVAIVAEKTFFSPTTVPNFTHVENPTIDFNRQILLPVMYSRTGARMATGDANGDQLTDFYAGGAQGQAGVLYVQKPDGSFVETAQPAFETDKIYEDTDAVFFDADGDADADLYVVSGGYECAWEDELLQDRLYLNDGKGTFSRASYQAKNTNNSCVKTFDADGDGDLDLFVGGGVQPARYPIADDSQLLINDGKGHFETQALALGLVADAAVADLNRDGRPDLVLVGEWSEPRWIENQPPGLFKNKIEHPMGAGAGWWTRLTANDLDNDGDLDFVVGNLGQNNQLKASTDEPITLQYADFDQNGTIDPFICYFNLGRSYPIASRDEALEQVVGLRKKFVDYSSYATATIEDLFADDALKKATKLTITENRSGLLINNAGKFTFEPLPVQAQFAPIYAIEVADVNKDGKKDLILAGNNANFRIRIGKMDANPGTVVLGNGKNRFEYVAAAKTGLQLGGDTKDMKRITTKRGQILLFFTNNNKLKGYVF